MHFTDYEIECAKQLNKAGIEWEPKEGDWLLKSKGNITWLCLGLGMTTEILHYHNGYSDHRWEAICDMEKKDAVWLPSFQQCRQLLKKEKVTISLSEQCKDVVLTAWQWKRMRVRTVS